MTSIPPAPLRRADDPLLLSRSTGDRAELEDAVARLRAVRRVAGAPATDDPATDGLAADGEADNGPLPPEATELAERLRARRSVGHVAAAYSAVHGHALTTADDGPGRRWAIGSRTAVVAAVTLLVLAVAVAVVALWPRAAVESLAPLDGGGVAGSAALSSAAPAGKPSASPPAADAAAGSVVVHVVGRVADPGLVGLKAGARVADALEGAGGPARDADLAALNLARSVVDGEQIYVPAEGEVPPGAAGSGSAAGGPVGSGADGLVDLNAADAAALDALPGIGPVLAERIVAWRTDNGPFTSVDELTEVSGIGPSVLENIRDSVRV